MILKEIEVTLPSVSLNLVQSKVALTLLFLRITGLIARIDTDGAAVKSIMFEVL